MNDDHNDIFNPKRKLPSVLPSVPKINTKPSQKKAKDMFDSMSSDEADIFSPRKTTSTRLSLPTAKKNDPIPSQSVVVKKSKPIFLANVSDDDDDCIWRETNPTPLIPKSAVNKKEELSHSDDDDIFDIPKKPPVKAVPPVKLDDDDSDDDMFDIPKKPRPKTVRSVKSDDDDD